MSSDSVINTNRGAASHHMSQAAKKRPHQRRMSTFLPLDGVLTAGTTLMSNLLGASIIGAVVAAIVAVVVLSVAALATMVVLWLTSPVVDRDVSIRLHWRYDDPPTWPTPKTLDVAVPQIPPNAAAGATDLSVEMTLLPTSSPAASSAMMTTYALEFRGAVSGRLVHSTHTSAVTPNVPAWWLYVVPASAMPHSLLLHFDVLPEAVRAMTMGGGEEGVTARIVARTYTSGASGASSFPQIVESTLLVTRRQSGVAGYMQRRWTALPAVGLIFVCCAALTLGGVIFIFVLIGISSLAASQDY
eukprot:PhM_4_TR198/c0_g1_i1/m.101518